MLTKKVSYISAATLFGVVLVSLMTSSLMLYNLYSINELGASLHDVWPYILGILSLYFVILPICTVVAVLLLSNGLTGDIINTVQQAPPNTPCSTSMRWTRTRDAPSNTSNQVCPTLGMSPSLLLSSLSASAFEGPPPSYEGLYNMPASNPGNPPPYEQLSENTI